MTNLMQYLNGLLTPTSQPTQTGTKVLREKMVQETEEFLNIALGHAPRNAKRVLSSFESGDDSLQA